MLPLAITLLVVSILLLPLAIRGRLTSRGLYCRKCKFDLAGLDPARDSPTCPECGGDLSQPKATRAELRRSSRAGVAVGVLMLLGGGVLTGISVTNNIPRIFAAMPDRVVLGLHAMGVDAAFTEIASNRLSRTNPLPESTWRALIDDAAAWQADENRAWDPRHGEVLALALISGRLTDEEVSRYVRSAVTTAVEFPENIRLGVEATGMMVSHLNSNRVVALNRVGSATHAGEQLMIWLTIPRAGIRVPEYVADINTWSGSVFTIPGGTGRSGGGNQLRVPLKGLDWSMIEPESEVTMFVEYTIAVRTQTSNTVIAEWSQTAEKAVRVTPPDTSIVAINTHPDIIGSFRDTVHARIGPIYIPRADQRVITSEFVDVAHSDFIYNKNPVGLSGDLYVLHDGRETRFCGINIGATQGLGMQGISLRLNEPAEVDEALLQSWLDAGRVTVELRPSRSLAERTHNIREILGVPLRFVGVPVTAVENTRTTFGETPEPTDTIGRPVLDTRVGEDP